MGSRLADLHTRMCCVAPQAMAGWPLCMVIEGRVHLGHAFLRRGTPCLETEHLVKHRMTLIDSGHACDITSLKDTLRCVMCQLVSCLVRGFTDREDSHMLVPSFRMVACCFSLELVSH